MLMNQPLFLCFYIPISGLSCKSQLNRLKLMISNSLQLFWAYLKLGGNFILAASTAGIETILSWFLNFMVWRFWIESICLLLYMAELFALCICAPICLQVLCVLMYIICVFSPVPQGVIQNGARMMSQGLFPGIRPLPINPIVSRTATVRSVLSLLSLLTHYMIDRFISQSESCLPCSTLAHIWSLPLTL